MIVDILLRVTEGTIRTITILGSDHQERTDAGKSRRDEGSSFDVVHVCDMLMWLRLSAPVQHGELHPGSLWEDWISKSSSPLPVR